MPKLIIQNGRSPSTLEFHPDHGRIHRSAISRGGGTSHNED